MTSIDFVKGKTYGVLRASVIADNGENHSNKTDMSHYNLLSIDNGQNDVVEQYQINIDIQSLESANVKCICIDPFINSIIPYSSIPIGFTPLVSNESDLIALDFVRRPIFDINLLVQSEALTANDIATKLDLYFMQDKPNIIVFGTKYDDQLDMPNDHYGRQRVLHGNKPSRGIDDIHMNQIMGKNDHCYQDGALLIQKGNNDHTFAAFFFCFDSQCKK
jgi:uncharacterized protein YukJ